MSIRELSMKRKSFMAKESSEISLVSMKALFRMDTSKEMASLNSKMDLYTSANTKRIYEVGKEFCTTWRK